MNQFLTVDAAAEILQVHTRTVRRYIKEGRLKAAKSGGQWRIILQDLMDFMGIQDTAELANRSVNNPEERSYIHPDNAYKVRVSSVVEVNVSSKDEALRLSSTITAAMISRERDSEARCDYQFMEDTGTARFLLWGSPRFVSAMIYTFDALIQE